MCWSPSDRRAHRHLRPHRRLHAGSVLLVDQGDKARGLGLLKEAVALAPQAGQIRLNYAKALIKAGQKSEARKELEQLAGMGDRFAAQAEVAELLKGL